MKVLVIGAGAAGLLTSRMLANQGQTVSLFETNPDVYTHFTGELTGRSSLDHIDNDCIDNQLKRCRVISLDTGKELDVPADLFLISADRFKLSLSEQATGSGVHIHFNSHVKEVKKRSSSALPGSERRDQLQGGGLAALIGEDRFRCDLVVGSDGASSSVARDFFPDPSFKTLKAIRFKIRGDHQFDVDVAHFFIGTEIGLGYLWCYPRTEQDINVGIGSIDQGPLTPILERFIKQRFGDRHYRIISRGGESIPYTGLRMTIADRDIALVGNAAGQVSSLLGGGLEATCKGAESLIRAIPEGHEFDPVLYREDYLSTYPRIQRSARIVPPLLRINAAGRLFSHIEELMGIIDEEEVMEFVGDGKTNRAVAKMAIRHPLLSLRLLRDHSRGKKVLMRKESLGNIPAE